MGVCDHVYSATDCIEIPAKSRKTLNWLEVDMLFFQNPMGYQLGQYSRVIFLVCMIKLVGHR